MLDKLHAVEEKYRELESLISDPAMLADMPKWQKLNRELAQLAPIVEKYREYKGVKEGLAEARAIFDDNADEDMRDAKNVIVEIRGGVGGEEAALFAGDLFRMYARYAERRGWRVDVIDRNATEIGGFKEISFSVDGAGAYSFLKYESGTHRVQRVPVTESSGRIHTSAVTVAVLPEAEEVEVEIAPADLRIDTYCASGAGGQYVNRTETAIRITHLPTGLVVQCQDEKSQLKNKEKAMRVLRARILEAAREEQAATVAADRKSQVGSGDRSERIRTYNFPQGRVTDHRIGLTLHKLDAILDGDLEELLHALITADQAEKLRQAE